MKEGRDIEVVVAVLGDVESGGCRESRIVVIVGGGGGNLREEQLLFIA